MRQRELMAEICAIYCWSWNQRSIILVGPFSFVKNLKLQ
jgi:hypothetical protein